MDIEVRKRGEQVMRVILICMIVALCSAISGYVDVEDPPFVGRVIYDEAAFEVNGHVFTLGYDTLQDMVDAGVVFEAEDVPSTLGHNESASYKLKLSDSQYAQVSVLNEANENDATAACTLSQLYYPVDLQSKQEVLKLNFPLTITEEELVASAGDPTVKNVNMGVTHYMYTVGKYGYDFIFANGTLSAVTLSYAR